MFLLNKYVQRFGKRIIYNLLVNNNKYYYYLLFMYLFGLELGEYYVYYYIIIRSDTESFW